MKSLELQYINTAATKLGGVVDSIESSQLAHSLLQTICSAEGVGVKPVFRAPSGVVVVMILDTAIATGSPSFTARFKNTASPLRNRLLVRRGS